MPYAVICGNTFLTRDDLQAECRRLLMKIGRIQDLTDEAFMHGLLTRHPSAIEKIGCGINYYEIRENPFGRARGFWLVRHDGSETSFSYRVCLNGKRVDRTGQLLKACRDAVAPICHQYKLAYFHGEEYAICEESGTEISWREAVVDHAGDWPFRRIADEWMTLLGDKYWCLPIVEPSAGIKQFEDESVSQQFAAFHNERAQLRIIHRDINSRLGSRGYRSTFVAPPKGG